MITTRALVPRYKWAIFSHANKPTSWVVHRYFGKFNKARQDRWVGYNRMLWTALERRAACLPG